MYDSLNDRFYASAMQYRVIGQSSHADKQTSILERIEELLDEHLPALAPVRWSWIPASWWASFRPEWHKMLTRASV